MSEQHAVPGTVLLVDTSHASTIAHAGGNNDDVVLIPTPTDDPDDPLNWKKSRKILSVVCMSVYMIATGIAASLMYSIIVPVSQATGLSVAALNEGTGYNYLAFGWGCLLWQPAANTYGKRPIYLLSLLMSIAVTVVVPYARSQGVWMALKILGGLAGAPLECLGEVSIADVFFSHERGTYLAAYSFTLYAAGFVAPILAGYITEGLGWQWVQYWGGIWLAMAFVFCFFFMEETKYQRHSVLANQAHNVAVGAVVTRNDEENTLPTPTNAITEDSKTVSDDDKGAQNLSEMPSMGQGTAYRPKTYLAKLKLFDKSQPATHIWTMFWRPVVLMRYPVIWYCGFSLGGSLIWYSLLNATASLILSAPPYDFGPSSVGLAYIASIIGALAGSLLAGNVGDWVVIKFSRRNNGIWQSEHRQWMNVVLAIVLPAALILWGVGAANHIHWFGLVFAMGLMGLAIAMGSHLGVSYCIDTYKDFGADAVASIICIRNTLGFAFSYGVTPWVLNMGYQNSFLLGAGAAVLQVSLFLIFIKWGPAIRAASAERYRNEVERAERLGIAH